MAIYRNVHLSFWTDNKVEDNFTPEDKYFYLYLLTNPQTNICGCYEVSYSQMVHQIGYSKERINQLLDRFERIHNIIRYNRDNKEVLILNWHKYNWNRSEKTLAGVERVAKHIKTAEFKKYISNVVENIRNNTPCMGHIYPMQASVSDTDTVSITDKKESNINVIKEIVQYLNDRCGTNYRYQTNETKKYINARLKEGYTVDDFKAVIDKKADEWIGTEQEKYLRPQTLFTGKFESYLNQKDTKKIKGNNNRFNHFQQREYDMERLEKELL